MLSAATTREGVASRMARSFPFATATLHNSSQGIGRTAYRLPDGLAHRIIST